MIILKNIDILNCKKGIEKCLNIAIKDGVIIDIFPANIKKEYNDFEIIDCKELLAAPSFVDIHTHLREPGFEYKETIQSGADAAKAGGFTDICCMANTNPVCDNESVVKYIKEKGKSTQINIYPIAAITKSLKGDSLTEFGHLVEAGIVAFSDDGVDVKNSFILKTAFEYAGFFNIPIFCHCEDKDLVANGVMNEGYFSTVSGLRGIPSISEEVMVFRNIKIAQYSNAHIHICHVSSKGSIEIIKKEKQNYNKISAETCPHYLILTDKDVSESNYNPNFKMNPPLRSESDKNSLITAINNDIIDCIATDHAPHAVHEKRKEFEYAPFGIIGLETAFAVSYKLVLDKKISLEKLIAKLSINPAKIVGIQKDELVKGAKANITILDLNLEKVYEEKDIVSKSKNSPFIDTKLKGWPVMTICNGKIVFKKEDLV